MAYNYGQSLENMLPLFGSLTNGANNPNFINQLAAAITSAAVGNTTTTIPKREKTPEPPPAPKLSSLSPQKMKPNQGTAPMDLENDSELDTLPNTTAVPTTTTKSINADKMSLTMHDTNLYLNGLLSAGINNAAASAGYMFFPTTGTPTAAATTTAGSMLMDPMVAAMQQMQQHGYATGTYGTMPSADPNAGIDGTQLASTGPDGYPTTMKEVIKTKNSILFPPNPNAPPPTIRERPAGCRTVFVGGLPENITEEIIREIFESCGEVTTLRMSKKNFCHIRYRHEASIDRAIYLSGYRVRISTANEPANFGRLHVDYAQARDDQYDFECRQRQQQREQRHRERVSIDRLRSQSPPPMPHYSDHEASLVAENLRNNETFVKAVQTISVWLERGDCTKRNANIFYSMIQSTHAHVRRLHTDKMEQEEDLRKARESYRKQMLTMSTQFTQIEKVFSAASHKKVWDHFTKAQRKNIDQWKKLATELRSVQIEDDEMEMSDDDRDYHSNHAKRARYDSDSLKEENDSLRCQLEAIRNEMSLERTDIKYDSDFREKQIKVLQETIRNMQTQVLQTKMREQKDAKTIEQLERKLKEAGVKQLLLKTKIRETTERLKDKEFSSVNSETSEILIEEDLELEKNDATKKLMQAKEDLKMQQQKEIDNLQIIDIDMYKSDDDVKIIEDHTPRVMSIQDTVNVVTKPEVEVHVVDKELKTNREELEINDKVEEKTEKPIENIMKCVKEEELKSLAFLEAKIIAFAAAYLVIHPFGVSSGSLCAYLQEIIKSFELQTKFLEDILGKYTNLFETEIITSGAETNIKWRFCGFLQSDLNK